MASKRKRPRRSGDEPCEYRVDGEVVLVIRYTAGGPLIDRMRGLADLDPVQREEAAAFCAANAPGYSHECAYSVLFGGPT